MEIAWCRLLGLFLKILIRSKSGSGRCLYQEFISVINTRKETDGHNGLWSCLEMDLCGLKSQIRFLAKLAAVLTGRQCWLLGLLVGSPTLVHIEISKSTGVSDLQ